MSGLPPHIIEIKSKLIMKAVFFFISVLMYSINAKAKDRLISFESDTATITSSVQKYAYWVTTSFMRSDAPIFIRRSGTGFFIRRNGRLFFITAMHLVAELKSENGNNVNHAHSINIHFSDKTSNAKLEYIAPFFAPLGYVFPGFWDQPDVAVFPIEDFNLPVHSVDELEIEDSTSFNNVKVCGFPEKLIYNPLHKAYINTVSTFFDFTVNETETLNQVLLEDYRVCIFNYVLYCEKLKDINTYGYSGGPVFVRNNQTDSWRMAGLYSWSDKFGDGKYVAIIVQIKHILAFIDQLVEDNGLKLP